MNIHILGKVCSGKGHFGGFLRDKLSERGVQVFSVGTGKAIRDRMESDRVFRKLVQQTIAERGLLADQILWNVVNDYMKENGIPRVLGENQCTIWDCVLRNSAQVVRMGAEGILTPDDIVFHIDVSDDVTWENLRTRMAAEGRSDDKEELHREGLRRFAKNLHSVLGAIREIGCPVERINGNLEKEVWPRIGLSKALGYLRVHAVHAA
jgi:adenylate kinase family enzyme